MSVPYHVRDARRTEAKPMIGLYGESGTGKTWSGLLMARGFVGPTGRIVMIETESGRGEAYVDLLPGGYRVVSMRDDFSPVNFGLAIKAAEEDGAHALIIDSASHEWEATGGVLAMAAANQADGKKGPLVWQQPKLEHQRHFVLRLLGTPIPLVIVCMRARYPMQERRNANGEKEWTRSESLAPYQADNFLFELFVHGWIDQEHKFHGSKYSRDDLRAVLRDGERISQETGQRLAAWARGAPAGAAGDGLPVGLNQQLPPPRPPAMTPLDEWKDLWRTVATKADWDEMNAKMTKPPTWSGFKWQDQKELLAARDAAKKRIGTT